MSTSVGPEMKFFRWILSHLTLILLLFLVVYVVWDWNVTNSQDNTADVKSVKKINVSQATESSVISSTERLEVDETSGTIVKDSNIYESSGMETTSIPASSRKTVIESTDISSQNDSDYQVSDDFSKRMNRYRQSLPVEEQKMMDNAGNNFHQVSDDSIKYPTDRDIDFVLEDSKIDTYIKNDISQEISDLGSDDEYPAEEMLDEVIVSDSHQADELMSNDKIDIPVTQPSVILPDNNSTIAKNTNSQVKVRTNNMQQQIRDRQRQLQNQMVMLVPFDGPTNKVINKPSKKQFNYIKPVINTPEQRRLLKEARTAFDNRQFTQAEVKYLQVMKELPDLPDVVGELANVYRAQKKTSDYLSTNTKFVERLVKN
ncbi:MAG: hypothetical protein OQL19_15780, partial [Gammaproteobacteria bacterium]|nr:hypothetical protein [Gammaproteobacteria bacterium]